MSLSILLMGIDWSTILSALADQVTFDSIVNLLVYNGPNIDVEVATYDKVVELFDWVARLLELLRRAS